MQTVAKRMLHLKGILQIEAGLYEVHMKDDAPGFGEAERSTSMEAKQHAAVDRVSNKKHLKLVLLKKSVSV